MHGARWSRGKGYPGARLRDVISNGNFESDFVQRVGNKETSMFKPVCNKYHACADLLRVCETRARAQPMH